MVKREYPEGVDDKLSRTIYDMGLVTGRIEGLEKGRDIALQTFKKSLRHVATKKREKQDFYVQRRRDFF